MAPGTSSRKAAKAGYRKNAARIPLITGKIKKRPPNTTNQNRFTFLLKR